MIFIFSHCVATRIRRLSSSYYDRLLRWLNTFVKYVSILHQILLSTMFFRFLRPSYIRMWNFGFIIELNNIVSLVKWCLNFLSLMFLRLSPWFICLLIKLRVLISIGITDTFIINIEFIPIICQINFFWVLHLILVFDYLLEIIWMCIGLNFHTTRIASDLLKPNVHQWEGACDG